MCDAFSCLVTQGGKVYWKAGVDSHSGIHDLFKSRDRDLDDSKLPPNNTFARIEIIPQNKDYLNSFLNAEWVYQIDEKVKPYWLDDLHEKLCRRALEAWKKQVYPHLNMDRLTNPINPFKIEAGRVTDEDLRLLKVWESVSASVSASVWESVGASVRASVGASVRDFVWESVRASVGASVRDSVWESVRDSVWESVSASVWESIWAYMGSLFCGIDKWRYTESLNVEGYPFQAGVDLWEKGLIPSFDGEVWRLHAGKDAKIMWEGTKKDLDKLGDTGGHVKS